MRRRDYALSAIRIIPLAAILVGSLGACGRSEKPQSEPKSPKVVRAQTLTVGETESPGSYVVTGTVKSLLTATLSSKVMGRVTAVAVREGDYVKKGQLLVSIDSRELQAATNVASANYRASVIGVSSAQKAVEIEDKTSRARVAQAESQVQQAVAVLASARARLDLVMAGPRTQEVSQSHIAVVQAQSTLKLAEIELARATKLVEVGAIARRELELAQNRYDLAKGQYDAAVQSENMAREGSRSQDIRAAEQGVAQAEGALKQARSGLAEAKAATLQVELRRKDVEVAHAQVNQASAAVQSAQVSLSYGQVLAPFDGRVVQRFVDPGSMASPGVPLLTVQGGEFRLEAPVPERVMRSVSIGDTSLVQIESLNKSPVNAKIVEIVPEGDAVSHNFVVKYGLGSRPGLKAGMFGRATIKTGVAKGIVIPLTATWEREGLTYVYALNKDGIARLRIVTLGEPFGESVEVLSGLNAGERIVVSNLEKVSDGCKVEVN